ncbi:hypothetical protein [Cellulosilyticum lentocellum]|uniref:Uncharacterized protein n=1 Tax=Cellulosilyticum lentocellum (strain ATCC 49066 / DSM 5427 / NCIMB 11756 / RHM5) TaxID=642492 RepID=F2JIG4_CELLD|nr:hypothetical protein [Cellulosilyticum lentocellum]ADZ84330.1 hypothetical protein Clole_2629 [Cellulosilyticum lentocellum DSM 5427]
MLGENHYCTYGDIGRILNRYCFEEKMRICHKYSHKLVDVNGAINVEKMLRLRIPYPWELETFVLLAITSNKEYNNNNFDGKEEKKFIHMINAIRNYVPKNLDENGLAMMLVSLGLNQFYPQECFYYRLFKYSYILNYKSENVDVQKCFVDKFGVGFNEFMELGYFLNTIYSIPDKVNINNIVNYVLNEFYPNAYSALSITRDEYIRQLKLVTDKPELYIYCLRPSYTYAFIQENNYVYFPLPHLIKRNVSSSLLYRITQNNDSLRQKIGKEVLENYLYELLKNSMSYDEIFKEVDYEESKKDTGKSLDVLLREKDQYLLIDSKSSVPSIGLRVMDKRSFDKTIDIMGKIIVQVYNQLTKAFGIKYNPFISDIKITRENTWGIAAILEDNYIPRHLIYENAAQKLKIESGSSAYIWMSNHIKIVSFYDIERFSLIGASIIEALIDQEKRGEYNSFSLGELPHCQRTIVNQEYLRFREDNSKRFLKTVNKLCDMGVITR